MNKEKILNGESASFNIKPIYLIVGLIILGIIVGLFVSNYFIIDANESINDWNKNIDEWRGKWENYSWGNHSWGNFSWGNSSNFNKTSNTSNTSNTTIQDHNQSNWTGFYEYLTPLTINDVILPIITTILLCISSFFLIALIVTYTKIYLNTKSKYILGLMFVLIPLLVVSIFLIRVVKSLFFSSALEYSMISTFLGFGISGLGGMLRIISVFMIIGLSILLYLSNQ